jgi:hypothetical protein
MLVMAREGRATQVFYRRTSQNRHKFHEGTHNEPRLEKLGGPPEFTLRPAFAGPVARAMTILVGIKA